MSNESIFIQIDLTPEYKRNLRDLSKRFRQIRADTQPAIEEIQSGNFIGDRIPGIGENYVILKVRVKNSNIQKGKSAGYRMIYQIESPVSVLLNHILKIRSHRYQPQRNSQHHCRVGCKRIAVYY